jgi:predicted ester cyclase
MSATSEQNKVLVRRLWEAMNNRQLEALDALLAPDVVRHCEATPGGDVRSLEQFKDFMRQDAAVFPDSVQTITHLVAEGDLVAVWATYEGTQQGPMGPLPPSRRYYFPLIKFRLSPEDSSIDYGTRCFQPCTHKAIPIRKASTGTFICGEAEERSSMASRRNRAGPNGNTTAGTKGECCTRVVGTARPGTRIPRRVVSHYSASPQ